MNFNQKFVKSFSILIISIVLAACGANNQNATLEMPAVNQLPPIAKQLPPLSASEENNLAWHLVNGKRQKIADFKGKAVVLDFWATYCPPCEEEIPHLVELSKQNPDLTVVGLHVGGDDDRKFVADFVTKYKMSYSLGYPEQALTELLLQGDDRIPQTVVFDRSGKLVQKFVGFTAETKADLDKAVAQALK